MATVKVNSCEGLRNISGLFGKAQDIQYTVTYQCTLDLCTASQRKFARETPDAKRDTFKHFREWLDDTYTGGNPSNEEWEITVQEDRECNYTAPAR